jgi:hypothetical protein
MSDILLTDENVIVVGRLGIGTDTPVSPLQVEGSAEITSTGSGAGFAFADRALPQPGQQPGPRWVWYANGGKAHLYADGHNDLVTVGSNGAVEANSFTSSGSNAGLHFGDRNPLAGGWSWYAQNGKARLSVDPRGDVLDVDSTNGLHVGSLHVDGAVGANSVNATSFHAGLLVSLNQSGLAVADAVGPNRHSVEIRASSILVTSPKASPAPGGPVPGGPQPQLPTETLDLIAEVKALRQEINAIKTKIGA